MEARTSPGKLGMGGCMYLLFLVPFKGASA